jgi:hypothetical protein
MTCSPVGGIMTAMKPDEARRFYEEDEDPARIHDLFDAAEREGRLRLTEPPRGRTELMPLRDLAHELGGELAHQLHELRLGDRLVRVVRRLARAIERSKVH